jgi:hypothetical protein
MLSLIPLGDARPLLVAHQRLVPQIGMHKLITSYIHPSNTGSKRTSKLT